MSKAIITYDQDSVIAEIDIAAPPTRVFEALTDPDQLLRWFTDATCPIKSWQMDARLGGSYSYATEKGNFQVNGVDKFKCHGEITEIDPPRLLVYTWVANWHLDPEKKTVVRWELTPTDRHARKGHTQPSGAGTGGAQGLQRRLGGRGRKT
jgi:uncharacterized protein YndB with AHSA1/START domain